MGFIKDLQNPKKFWLWNIVITLYVLFLGLTAILPYATAHYLYDDMTKNDLSHWFWLLIASTFIFVVLFSIGPVFIFRKYFKIVRKTDNDKNVSE